MSSPECKSPLGMEDGRIKDSQITTTGVAKGTAAYGWQARLNRNIPKCAAWCVNVSGGSTKYSNYDQHIKIDLVKLTVITAIAIQPRHPCKGTEYVKDFKISYRKDTRSYWTFCREKEQSPNEAKIFQVNTNGTHRSSVVRHDLNDAFIARYIRVHPGYNKSNSACMRLELYGCPVEEVIVSYSMPVGQKTKNGKVDYKDTTYTGLITNGLYKNGTGILTDGKFGPVDAKSLKSEGWVGWNNTKSEYIDIIFEFSHVRKFKNVTLTVNVDKKRSHAVFDKSQIFFASTKDGLSGASFLEYCPHGYEAQDNPYNANMTLSLCENSAKFVKLRLYFGRVWLLITEISFNSVPVSTGQRKMLQDCSRNTTTVCAPSSLYTTTRNSTSNSTTRTTREYTTNSTITFVVIAVGFAVLIVILFIIVITCKRRRQASKLSSSVNTVEIQNETAQTVEESLNNERYSFGLVGSGIVGVVNHGLNHYSIPAECNRTQNEEFHTSPMSVFENLQNGGEISSDLCLCHGEPTSTCEETALYEEVIQILPPSEYVDLTINPQSERETDSVCSSGSSGYVFPENCSRVSPYEEVQIWPPLQYVEFKRNLPGTRRINSDHSSSCANPGNDSRASPYEEVKISPLSEYIELNRNLLGAREINTDQGLGCFNSAYSGRAPYEDVKISPLSGYTELDKNKQSQDRKNHEYQKLLKHGSGYVISLSTASTTTTSGDTHN